MAEAVKLRGELALEMGRGNVNSVLRRLKDMPILELEAISKAEMEGKLDVLGLDEDEKKGLERGLEKLNFYVCGILMHRILEGE
jgi:hypothetical protein